MKPEGNWKTVSSVFHMPQGNVLPIRLLCTELWLLRECCPLMWVCVCEREREKGRDREWVESCTERTCLKNHNGDFSGPVNSPFELKVFKYISGFTSCPGLRGSF